MSQSEDVLWPFEPATCLLICLASLFLLRGWMLLRLCFLKSISATRCYATKSLPPAARRTQSILLDEPNPIIHQEQYKLHKGRAKSKQQDDDGSAVQLSAKSREWEANPYRTPNTFLHRRQQAEAKLRAVRMLASPLRMCGWSRRVMPKDLLIPLRAVPHDDGPDGKQTIKWFPREILHPSTLKPQDRAGGRLYRSYVICKRTAVYDAANSDALGKKVPAKVSQNPLLPFQVDSQLRRRILQELELLVNARDGECPALRACSAEQATQLLSGKGSVDGNLFEKGGPAAFLHLPSGDDPGRDRASCSRLVRLNDGQAAEVSALAPHSVPLYNFHSIFPLTSPVPDTASEPAEAGTAQAAVEAETQSVRPQSKKGKTVPPRTLQDLAASHPEIYEREVVAQRDTAQAVRAALSELGVSATDELVFVPARDKRWTPLLVSLWRWRMWAREGWSGDGFGVLEATARKAPFSG